MLLTQSIACTNKGAVVMNFSVRWLDSDGHWHTSHWNSGNYPINETRTSPDLASIGIPDDAMAVSPYVHAVLGMHAMGNQTVNYAANGVVAHYIVRGMTLNVTVDLQS